MSYKDRTGPENRRVFCKLCKAALPTLPDKGLPSHTGCTTWSFGVSSTSERENQGNWKCVRS